MVLRLQPLAHCACDRGLLAKATTSLLARAQLDPPDFTQITDGSDGFELVVPVTVTDRGGTEVVHAEITTWVTPTPGCK